MSAEGHLFLIDPSENHSCLPTIDVAADAQLANAIPTSTNDTSNSQRASRKTDSGAIAGGTVGGLVVLFVVIFLTFCILRRRRRQQEALPHLARSNSRYDKPELQGSHYQLDRIQAPLEAEYSRAELGDHHASHEAGSSALYEMYVSSSKLPR